MLYTYDNGGNILSVTMDGQAYKNYSYTDDNWYDKLTAYNGQTITYDQIGNPLQYRDGYELSWSNGRQLTTVYDLEYFLTNTYQYNADGLRTYKNAGGIHVYYYWVDGHLIAQRKGQQYIVFLYDENSTPYGFMYQGEYYYYLQNAQGDIIGIVNSNGDIIVKYTYSAWGEILSITGSQASTIGQKSPLRYRGYYYDDETGFYYLQSRYYDPVTGRFINADSQLNQKDGILGYNMFAYCHNNPIMYSDPTGHSITLACIIIGAVIGAVAGGCAGTYVSKKQTGKVNGWAVAAGAVGGGVVGGLIGWGVGAAITAVGTAATGSAATAAAPVVQQVAEKASTALQTYYPPNDGFSGAVQKITLEAGTLIQRTGDLVGRYIAPAGTPTQMLSLPAGNTMTHTSSFLLPKGTTVLAGKAAPLFGQSGGGVQWWISVLG